MLEVGMPIDPAVKPAISSTPNPKLVTVSILTCIMSIQIKDFTFICGLIPVFSAAAYIDLKASLL